MKKERNEFYAYESSVENVQTSHPRKRPVLKKPFPCIKNVRQNFEIRLMTKSKAKQNANTSTIQNPNISVFLKLPEMDYAESAVENEPS